MPKFPIVKSQQQEEEWRDVVGAVGILRVSDLGRIMRIGRFGYIGKRQRKPRNYLGKIIVPTPPKNRVWVGGRGSMDVAVLILEAFISPPPEGMECCHNDDDRSNNKLSNLRWDTHANNVKDGYKNQKRDVGEKHHWSKMTEEQVLEARELRKQNKKFWTYSRLAHRYGVSRGISAVINGISWRHLS